MPAKFFLPPGGFAGFAEQTIATKTLISSRAPSPRRKTRTRKKPVRRKKTTTRKRRAPVKSERRRPVRKKKLKRLVKGSAAAKRHMAKLRRMRKK